MIHLGKDGSWESCENTLDAVARQRGEHTLAVATKPKLEFLGGSVSRLQVLLTWASAQPNAPIQSWAVEEGQREEFVHRLPGLAAGLSGRTIRSADGRTDLTESLREAAFRRLDDLQGEHPARSKGMGVDVVCADRKGRGFPRVFYRGLEELKSLKDFQIPVREMIEIATPESLKDWHDARDRETIADLVFEAFKNTDEHATTDLEGNDLELSLRGVSIRHHSFLPRDLDKSARNSVPLVAFCDRLELPYAGASHVRLLEVSVFDSGIGYAAHLTRRPLAELGPAEEFKAVEDCFRKNVTSKERSGAGQGLALIATLMRRGGGFVRLRTGRLSLFGDGGVEGGDELRLVDAHGGGDPVPRAKVRGTVLTCVLPLRKK